MVAVDLNHSFDLLINRKRQEAPTRNARDLAMTWDWHPRGGDQSRKSETDALILAYREGNRHALVARRKVETKDWLLIYFQGSGKGEQIGAKPSWFLLATLILFDATLDIRRRRWRERERESSERTRVVTGPPICAGGTYLPPDPGTGFCGGCGALPWNGNHVHKGPDKKIIDRTRFIIDPKYFIS